MPKEFQNMTPAVRRAMELESLRTELEQAKELISELRDEARQLRQHIGDLQRERGMNSRARLALMGRTARG